MTTAATQQALEHAPLYQLAHIVRSDWKNVYFGAVPYLDAMAALDAISDSYGADDGRMVVSYFLSNASAWRGETARAVKAELRRRVAR